MVAEVRLRKSPGTMTRRHDSFASITPSASKSKKTDPSSVFWHEGKYRAAVRRENGLPVAPSGATPHPASRLPVHPKSQKPFSDRSAVGAFALALRSRSHSL